jgi:general secretion pathway protein E
MYMESNRPLLPNAAEDKTENTQAEVSVSETSEPKASAAHGALSDQTDKISMPVEAVSEDDQATKSDSYDGTEASSVSSSKETKTSIQEISSEAQETAEKTPSIPAEKILPAPIINPDWLGQRLLKAKAITPEDLDKALTYQVNFGGRLGTILIRLGAIAEDVLLAHLVKQLHMPLINSKLIPTDPALFLLVGEAYGIDPHWWLDQEIVAWRDENVLHILARDPVNPTVREIFNHMVQDDAIKKMWYLCRNQDLDRALDRIDQTLQVKSHGAGDEISHLKELAEEAPVVELVNNTFSQAFHEGASDIHIEPSEHTFNIRYRIDGVLQTKTSLPRDRFDAVASRIKLISDIDIAERRLPQDGRVAMRVSGKELDVRVSTLPGVWGESIVMRLLPKERESLKLELLGFEEDNLETFNRWVHDPHGIMLVTGPTGSGKSTTLYAALGSINTGKDKIITIEDPVEFNIPGITQVQVHAEIEFTFGKALRSILRQDPDTVMLGEIRDLETAEIAIQAALTGHLVMSTLHTNDALSAFTRMVDMGVEPFLVASAVNGVLAQRLVRKLCPHCKVKDTPNHAVLEEIQAVRQTFPHIFPDQPQWHKGKGCSECQGIGYKGRMGIYEVANVTPEIQDMIMKGASAKEIGRLARTQGYRTLREAGFAKAWKGLTSVDEILRVTGVAGDES